MTNASVYHSFYVDTPNNVGEASKLSNWIFHKFGSNLRSFYGSSWDQNGRFYFVTDNDDAVMSGFNDSQYSNWGEQDVIVCFCDDQAGVCAKYTALLSEAGINIHFLYTTVFDSKPAIIFSTDDNARAVSLFN